MIKLVCAPMATLSHEAFRRCVETFGGCDEYFNEMINASTLLTMGPWEKYYLLNGSAPDKIVWQLTSNRAETLGQAAEIISRMGGIGVDLNMGCSAPQIYKTGAGIAWMLKPIEETKEAVVLVKKMLDESEKKTGRHLRFSVKCRLGDENFTEESLFRFTDMLVENGVELITLHPRTVKEKYRLTPKYEYVQKLCERYENRILVYTNGNICDENSARFALSRCPGSDTLMIARAAAQKPWIFAQLKKKMNPELSQEEITFDAQELAIKFIDDVVECQPEEFYRTRIQRFFTYFCQNFAFGHYFQSQMLNYHSIEESKEKVADYFTKQKEERFITF